MFLVFLTVAVIIIFIYSILLLRRHSIEHRALPIYIISLKKHKEQRLKPLLKDIKDDPRYFVQHINGINGHEDVIETFLSKGQIGCWLSHADMWNDIVSRGHHMALILEDDADIQLPEKFDEIEKTIQELPKHWHMCYLGGRYAKPTEVYSISERLETSKTSCIWHSHCYLVKQEGAKALKAQSNAFNESRIKSDFKDVAPVDDWMTHPDRGLNIYKTKNELVHFKYDGISETPS